MLRDRRPASQSGLTLVSTLILAAMVAVTAIALGSLLFQSKSAELRTVRWGRGEQVLVSTASQLQDKPFSSLVTFCKQKRAYNKTRSGICTGSGNTLASGPVVQPGVDTETGQDKLVEVLRNWEGDPSTSGSVCVELTSCNEKAGGYILEVTLKGYWADASKGGANAAIAPKVLMFRRTR